MNRILPSAPALLLASLMAATGSAAAPVPSDTPHDYAYSIVVNTRASQGVTQLRLPKEVYLHAQSPQLHDLRVFDAGGNALPFALQLPQASAQTSHTSRPLRIFPLMGGSGANPASQLDVEVSTSGDGRLNSVRLRGEAASGASTARAERLSGLLLDLRPEGAAPDDEAPLIDGLRFTLPAGTGNYRAQIGLDVSDDLKQWVGIGATELNWLVNSASETLSSDRLELPARRFRYARLHWLQGTPLQFAAIHAETPLLTEQPAPSASLLLPAARGREPRDLVYAAPVALAASKVGLQFSETSIVLPFTLGRYRELAPAQLGQSPSWRFEPLLHTTMYQITQSGQTRRSSPLSIAPASAAQWVLRTDSLSTARPQLELHWTPATLVFLGNGRAPYTLAFGRSRASAAEQPLAQVAPGFSPAELAGLDQATPGPLLSSPPRAQAEQEQAAGVWSARNRNLALWGTLLLGVAVLAGLVWRLSSQMRQPADS
ncbi:DUF3999 family protein [Oxalobacteraceae bacterium]|nr:DUF3999 family protein [Oxalobacteraceae bacterium]